MNKDVLAQYTDLQQEIKYISKRLDKLMNERSRYEKMAKHDLVRASSHEYPYVEHNVHLSGITDRNAIKLNSVIGKEIKTLERRYDDLLEKTNEVVDFIDSIDDSFMRSIITYRFIENYSWNDVADAIGGGNTEGGVKMAFQRFIEKSK